MKRQIKKTVITYKQNNQLIKSPIKHQNQQKLLEQLRERSREKLTINQQQANQKQINIDVNTRKARLQAMKKARQLKSLPNHKSGLDQDPTEVKIVFVNQNICVQNAQNQSQNNFTKIQNNNIFLQTKTVKTEENNDKSLKIFVQQQKSREPQSQDSEEEKQTIKFINKPVFLSKEDRNQYHEEQQIQHKKQQQRKRKNLRYTTKMLLEQTLRKDQEHDLQQEVDNINDDEDENNLPDDADDKNQEIQYELWKVRELKRIRRDRELRQKHLLQKTEIQRRRLMNNEQILLENRLLGSDSTDQQTETKYVFMQKYYHKGAFYQDFSDPIFQRDYNLPTPLQMQDKSVLPSILQKRKGNFGKKGQSKYSDLVTEDTTDTNPLTRPDESILNNWKSKLAGYKK